MDVAQQLADAYQIAGKLITGEKLTDEEITAILDALLEGQVALENTNG